MISTLAAKAYAVFAGTLLIGYLIAEHRGTVFFGEDDKSELPKDARGTRGYRSHSFWYIGHQGGK